MEKFYENHIPKSSLPSDFGGDLESVEVLHKRHCDEFSRMRNFFLAEEKQTMGSSDLSYDKSNNLENDIMRENVKNFKNISID